MHRTMFFQKDSKYKSTRAEIGTKGAPFTPERYSELDLIIANRSAKSGIKDVQSVTDYYFPSDRFPTEAKIKPRLKKDGDKQKDDSGKWKGLEKPDEQDRKNFEDEFVNYYKIL